jgi:hypothetical protein
VPGPVLSARAEPEALQSVLRAGPVQSARADPGAAMKPGGRLARKTPLRRTAMKRGKGRKPSEFARIYGSKERVEWIKSLPCVGCGATPSDNAHTVSGGKGRKADAETIAPLCPDRFDRVGCHTKYDQHQPPFDRADARDRVQAHALFRATQWERRHSGLTPLSAIVPRVMRELTEGGE